MQSQQWVREIPSANLPVAITKKWTLKKNANFEKEPDAFSFIFPFQDSKKSSGHQLREMMVPWPGRGFAFVTQKWHRREGWKEEETWWKLKCFLWLQRWPTRWDAVESSCLKWKMSLNILEHTSWQELTCNPFLNWTGLGKSILATSSLAIDSWDHLRVSTGIEWTSW